MIPWMKRAKSFQSLLNFFVNFSQVLLMKVLLIKKACNNILFQTKVFSGKTNGTTLVMYLIKVTVYSGLIGLKVIRQIDNSLNVKIENRL